ncbi:MAG TPA: GNAT family N-acetyltransferase, partial [Solirubrobacterales bacterium]|nr:GNAT family N-acetyltransferase [Solirubrobacterales bacterium]
FFEPDYVLPLAEGFDSTSEVHLLTVRDGDGSWLCCLPVCLRRRWHKMPLRTLGTWRGHDFFGLLGTPLVRPDRMPETLAVMLEALPAAEPSASVAVLEWLGSGPVAEAVDAVLADRSPQPILFERFERAALRRRPEPTYLEETLSAKRRRELRRQWRKLGEEAGGEPRTVELAQEDGCCGRFVALEAAGRKSEVGEPVAADPAQVSFFGGMCRRFAERGRLQMLALQVGEETVAMQCNLRAGSTLFALKVAYDERFRRFSPGILLEREAIEIFHEDPELDLMDACSAHDNRTINRLWPDRRTVTTVILPAAGLKARSLRPMLLAGRELRDRRHERKATT